MVYLICDNTNTNNGWGTYTNQIALQIKNIKNITDLEVIINDLQNYDYLSIHKDLDSLLLSIKNTKDDEIEFAKTALIEVLDKSQLYLSYSEIEDTKHQINKSDIKINNYFYK